MRICITGALGHIGSRLIRELPGLFPACEMRLIDNFLTQRYCSLFNLPQAGKYDFIEADILTADLTGLFTGCDVVVHLAAISEAAGSFEQLERTEEVNYLGTERVARACAKTGIPLIFLSTCSVYGTNRDTVDEDCGADELRPQTPYASSKLRAEQMLSLSGKDENLHFVTLRFATIVGPSVGMRFHTAANKFSYQACIGKPISVWKTAYDQKRPYLELGDAIRAIARVIEKERFDRTPYNVLTANTTVRQIVEMIKVYVPQITVELVDSKAMNDLSYEVSRKKFEALGFRFQGSLYDAVGETISLLHQARSAGKSGIYHP